MNSSLTLAALSVSAIAITAGTLAALLAGALRGGFFCARAGPAARASTASNTNSLFTNTAYFLVYIMR